MKSNNKLAISVLSLVLLVSYLAVGAFAITPSPNNTRSLHSPYGALALCCPRCSTDNCVQAEVKKIWIEYTYYYTYHWATLYCSGCKQTWSVVLLEIPNITTRNKDSSSKSENSFDIAN